MPDSAGYKNLMQMNGWFITAGTLLVAAFLVHVIAGTRFYALARPAGEHSDACEAWLLGRCGFQMISVDLALASLFLLLLGSGAVSRNFLLELFLLLTYGGWFLFWLVALTLEKSAARIYWRLCHWALFLAVVVLIGIGMAN